MLWTGKTIPRVSVKKYGISYLPYPGKNIKWDPADPTWDPRCVPGGIPPGIPPGIMEHPALGSLLKFLIASRQSHLGSQVCPRWDPTWDYGTSRLKFLIASHLRRHIPFHIPFVDSVKIALERFKDFISSIIYDVSNFSVRQSNP